LARFVFVFTPFFFPTFDKVPGQGWMQFRQEGFVETVSTNEMDYIGKVLVPSRCQFQLNECMKIQHADLFNGFAHRTRVGIGQRSWLTAPWKQAGEKEIEGHSVGSIRETF